MISVDELISRGFVRQDQRQEVERYLVFARLHFRSGNRPEALN